MKLKKELLEIYGNRGALWPVLLVPIVALLLTGAYILTGLVGPEEFYWEDEGVIETWLSEGESVQGVDLALTEVVEYYLMDSDDQCDCNDAPHFTIGLIGCSYAGSYVGYITDRSHNAFRAVFGMLFMFFTVLVLMSVTRALNENRFGRDQLLRVLGGWQVLFALAFPLVVSLLGAYIGGLGGFVLTLLIGVLLALFIPFLAMGWGASSARLVIQRLRKRESYVYIILAYLLIIIYATVFDLLAKGLLRILNVGEIGWFISASLLAMGVLCIQGVFLYLYAGQIEPKPKEAPALAIDHSKLVADMLKEGKTKLEIKSELRRRCLSIEEIEGVL
jgi:hypothetical protein